MNTIKIYKTMCNLLLLFVIVANFGCSKEENISIVKDKEIKFKIGSRVCKTVYDKKNEWQINWIEGDQITIFCNQANNKKAVAYNVTPDKVNPSLGTLNKDASENEIGLRWGEGSHNFYAVYPSLAKAGGNITYNVKDEGNIIFKFPKEQICNVGSKDASGNYYLTPSMDLAYMVAKQVGVSNNTDVNLHFYPIATTLEITINGKTQQDIISGSEGKDVTNILIKDLTIKIDNSKKYINSKYEVQFDATSDFDKKETNVLKPWGGTTNQIQIFTIKMDKPEGISIGIGESVTFTAFLPPVENLSDVNVLFNVASGSGKNEMVVLKTESVTHGSKRRIKLPNATEYPFSALLQKVIVENNTGIKVDTLNGVPFIDITNSKNREIIERISTISLNKYADEIDGDLDIRYLKGIEYLKTLRNLIIIPSKTENGKIIDLTNSTITGIDFSLLKDLPLSYIDIRRCENISKLKELNQVKTLESIIFQRSNKITTIDVSSMPNLKSYNSSGCKLLSYIDFSNCDKLTNINCPYSNSKGGSLKSINVTGCTSLSMLSCGFNVLEEIIGLNSCANLINLYCHVNNLKELDLSGCIKLNKLSAQGGLSTPSIDFSNNSQITYIMCSQNKELKEVTGLENCVNLKEFYCTWSDLQSIDFSGNLDYLHTIDCSVNQKMKSITGLESCPALKNLNLHACDISSINLLNNKELVNLTCTKNFSLDNIDVSNCSKLKKLHCFNTGISSLDLSNNNDLTDFDASSCLNLTNIKFASNNSLITVICYGCALTDLDITNASNLTNLNASNNKLSSIIGLSDCINLKSLDLDKNNLTSLDVSNFTILTTFRCQYNMLQDINITTLTSLSTFLCGSQKNNIVINLYLTQEQFDNGLKGNNTQNASTINCIIQ